MAEERSVLGNNYSAVIGDKADLEIGGNSKEGDLLLQGEEQNPLEKVTSE